MAITAKELREKRAKFVKEARAIADKCDAEKREQTAEEKVVWARIMGDVDPEGKRIIGEEERLKAEIDKLERLEQLEGEMKTSLDVQRDLQRSARIPGNEDGEARGGDDGANLVTEETRSLALQAWVRTQTNRGDVTDQHREACRLVGIKPNAAEFPIQLHTGNYRRFRSQLERGQIESRAGASAALSINIGPSGAYTIPEGFVYNLEIALLQYGGIRRVADVMRTVSGNDLPWPMVNDTTVKGALLQNNQQVTASDLSFSVIVFHAYKYTSNLALVPVELIEDSAFNLSNELGDLLGIRLGRIQADHYTTGTGAGQPTGIITAATSGVTGFSTTALAADDIYTLKHSVDPAYREGAVFMMNDLILVALKKLKDGAGRYLWQTSLAGGAPDMIDGDPLFINQSMDSTIASGKKTIVYGLCSKYKIRDVAEIRLRRLVERFADQDQEGFVAFYRGDANLLDAGTHPVKYMTH